MTELPEDLLISDVLLRLPLKSIGRFRCVSKQWRSWLSSHQFINALIPDSPESIIMEGSRRIHDFPEEYCVTSFHTSTMATKSCINRYSNILVMKNLTYPLTEEHFLASVEGSCRGFVLLSHYKKNRSRSSKVLMNPVTLEAEEVVNYPSSKLACHCGLGYDSLSDDYKVVTLTYQPDRKSTRVDIYSVRTKTWKTAGESKYRCMKPIYSINLDHAGVFVNGRIHWKVSEPDIAIASFILAREEFEILHPPSVLDQTAFSCGSLCVLGGCLSFLNLKSDRSIDVWMMKEFGVHGSWTKFSTVPYPRPQDPYSWETTVDVVCLLGDDEILVHYGDTKQFWVYDCASGDWKDVSVDGIPPEKAIDFCISYTQTLVSLSHNRLELNT